MSETGVAGVFIALAVLIVLSGPARLLRLGRLIGAALRGARRERGDDAREPAAGD